MSKMASLRKESTIIWLMIMAALTLAERDESVDNMIYYDDECLTKADYKNMSSMHSMNLIKGFIAQFEDVIIMNLNKHTKNANHQIEQHFNKINKFQKKNNIKLNNLKSEIDALETKMELSSFKDDQILSTLNDSDLLGKKLFTLISGQEAETRTVIQTTTQDHLSFYNNAKDLSKSFESNVEGGVKQTDVETLIKMLSQLTDKLSSNHQKDLRWSETILACLKGHNERVVHTSRFENCKKACEQTTEFICRSADYFPSDGVCELSPATSASDDYKEPCYEGYEGNLYAELIPACEDGVIIAGQCLLISSDERDWYGAKESCSAQKATLVSLTDPAAFHQYMTKNYEGAYFWLGASDIQSEGDWRWLNGNPLGEWFPWPVGQPRNYGGNENCLNWGWKGNLFNDGPCSNKYRYICEKGGL